MMVSILSYHEYRSLKFVDKEFELKLHMPAHKCGISFDWMGILATKKIIVILTNPNGLG